jgi:hypothetical protein
VRATIARTIITLTLNIQPYSDPLAADLLMITSGGSEKDFSDLGKYLPDCPGVSKIENPLRINAAGRTFRRNAYARLPQAH